VIEQEESLGALAVRQIELALQGQTADRVTRRILRRALPAFGDAVERLCPAALRMGPGGLQMAYGPYLGGATGTTFVFANSSGDALACTANWSEINSQPIPDATGTTMRAMCWKSIHDAIRDEDAAQALVFLSGLLGVSGRATVDGLYRTHMSNGFHPAICVIAGKSKEKAAGACYVIALPPSIDLTFADTSAMAS
jgi:hypothetical protein